MADPHKGGLCWDGSAAGFMKYKEVDPGVFEVLCDCGSWVLENAYGDAIEYSDYPAPPTPLTPAQVIEAVNLLGRDDVSPTLVANALDTAVATFTGKAADA